MITFDRVTKRFEERQGRRASNLVLDDLSLSVVEGECYVLLGPSGCGKTTTLRMIAGLDRPDAGTIRIAGQPVFSRQPACWTAPEARPVGMVFQSYALWPSMSVVGNVAFALRYGRDRLDQAMALTRAREALALVQIPHLADRPVTQLSGGQQQRVALARAIAQRPRVLLMDEPLSNLDPQLRAEVRRELRVLMTQLGITSVVVTHDREDAMALADRVAVMRAGRIEQAADPHVIYGQPASPFVASLLGEISFVTGNVLRADSEGLRVDIAGATIDAMPASGVTAGMPVRLGVRPRRVAVDAAGSGMLARLVRRDFTGEEYRCEFAVGPDRIVAYTSDATLAAGEQVRLTIGRDGWLVFPGSAEVSAG